jgi:hypothetical protein
MKLLSEPLAKERDKTTRRVNNGGLTASRVRRHI